MGPDHLKDLLDPSKQGPEKALENLERLVVGSFNLTVDILHAAHREKERKARAPTELEREVQEAVVRNIIPDYLENDILDNPLLLKAATLFLQDKPSPISDPEEFPAGLLASLLTVIKGEASTAPCPKKYDVFGDGIFIVDLPLLLTALDDGSLSLGALWDATSERQEYQQRCAKILRDNLERDFGSG